MEYGAIDLHKKESQIRIVSEGGAVIDQRIATTRERFTHVFWGRPRMRILVEASTESEWVAQRLEHIGHEVVVADPNYGPVTAVGASRPIGATWRLWPTRVSTARIDWRIGDPRGNTKCSVG